MGEQQMFTNTKLSKAIRLAAMFGAASATAFSTNVVAQEAEAAEEVEKITVTGSLIKRTTLEGTAPVVTLTAEDIRTGGFNTIEDVLNSLPSVVASNTAYDSNGASGTASLNLRGLGASRTLVLVNGRRLSPGSVTSESADVNQIPVALVKRIDVMTGGSATAYGADAVAGVVNFILDDEFTGIQMDVGFSGYQHNNSNDYIQGLMDQKGFDYPTGTSDLGGKTWQFDFTMGSEFADGKGNAVAYVGYKTTEGMLLAERDYASCALNTTSTSCGGSANAVVPNFFLYPYDAETGSPDYGTEFFGSIDSSGSFIDDDGTNRYNYNPINYFYRPDERFTLGSMINYDVNDSTRVYLELNYMLDDTDAQIAESGTFFAEEYKIDMSSELLSDAQRAQLAGILGVDAQSGAFAAYIGKRNVEGGPRTSLLNHSTFRVVLGVEGDINDDWYYDVNGVFNQTKSEQGYVNDFYAPAIEEALENNEYSVFTYNGVTQEQASALLGTAIQSGEAKSTILTATVSGDLGFQVPTSSENIAAAFGAEHREISIKNLSDFVYEQGLLLGQGGATPSNRGAYNVQDIFAEVNIPLLEDHALAHSLSLDLAARHSEFSTAGGATTYKFAVDYMPIESLKLRGSVNRSIRAPGIGAMFSPQSLGLWSGDDNCAVVNEDTGLPVATAEECARTGVTAAQYGNLSESPAAQYNQLSGGNTELKPEVGDTVSFGAVWDITDTIGVSVDYWAIEMSDTISSVGAQLQLNQCLENGLFCDNINRSPAGSLWIGEEGYIDNLISNIGGTKWEGVDVSANGSFDVTGGSVNVSLVGAYSLKREVTPVSLLPDTAYSCEGNINTNCLEPDWRHTLSARYDNDSGWFVTAKWRFFSALDYVDVITGEALTTDTLVEGGLDAQSYIDVVGGLEVTDNVYVQFGINNILDEEPPIMGATLGGNGNTQAGYYDTLGSLIFTDVSIKF
jgi:outer membrane receptor protein involved in Fe transport